jgi:hypothetical protein
MGAGALQAPAQVKVPLALRAHSGEAPPHTAVQLPQ